MGGGLRFARAALWLCALFAGALAWRPPAPAAPEGSLRVAHVVFTGRLEGALEPCG